MLNMKKTRNSIIGGIGLALLLSFGFEPHQGSATTLSTTESITTNEIGITAFSRFVDNHWVNGPGKAPQTILYNKDGWTGTLNLMESHTGGLGYNARYAGTVYCEGRCTLD
ncbi:hypothetical protein HNO89_001372 [Sporosarcina luteola]|nr:hypothetical protein [Sporosarcina luteola]